VALVHRSSPLVQRHVGGGEEARAMDVLDTGVGPRKAAGLLPQGSGVYRFRDARGRTL
jgi:hypothetical protein